jgi:hypothetical protein
MKSPTTWPVTTSTVKATSPRSPASPPRHHAQQRVLGEYLLLPPPTLDEDRPVVVDRSHPSWAEVDAEQRERLGDPPAEEGRS